MSPKAWKSYFLIVVPASLVLWAAIIGIVWGIVSVVS